MDKNAILKAICDPTLVRRAATALKADPGPLEMVRVDTDDTLGYLATCCVYRGRRGGKDTYVAISDFGSIDMGYAMATTSSMMCRYLASIGRLDDDGLPVTFISVTSNPDIDDMGHGYWSVHHRIMAEDILADGSRRKREVDTPDAWWSIVLRDKSLEEAVQALEARHDD